MWRALGRVGLRSSLHQLFGSHLLLSPPADVGGFCFINVCGLACVVVVPLLQPAPLRAGWGLKCNRFWFKPCRGVGATLCCPGPLATGLDGKPRMVYGANGLVTQAATGMSKKRVSTARAAELITRAAYHCLGV